MHLGGIPPCLVLVQELLPAAALVETAEGLDYSSSSSKAFP